MSDQDSPSSQTGRRGDDPLTRSVVNVIGAAFDIGAILAKAAAELTAGGRPVPGPAGEAPVQAMIHYSLATVSNLIAAATSAVGGLGDVRSKAPSGAPMSRPAGHPRVRPGATLRVPLSVENPGDQVMSGLAPLVRGARHNGLTIPNLPEGIVRFEPAHFDVGPKDFEKLTVFVAVPETAPAGRYDLVLALGPNEADLPLSFEIVDPGS